MAENELKFLIEGHRGVQSLYPENTLDSFRAALELGVDFVELDLQTSRDGEIVIHHDYSVQGTLIRSLLLSEIKKIDCGSRVNPLFPQQKPSPDAKIPLLEELFQMVQNSTHPNAARLCFNLEIKSDIEHPEYTMPLPELAKKLVEMVKKHGLENRVYYSSFHPAALFQIRNADRNAEIAFLYAKGAKGDFLPQVISLCKQLDAKIFSPLESLVTARVVDACAKEQLWVIPWTVNDPKRCRELKELGVQGIITDYPQYFVE